MDDNDARITVEVEKSYLPPSQFESLFLSVKHTEKDIERFLEAFKLL